MLLISLRPPRVLHQRLITIADKLVLDRTKPASLIKAILTQDINAKMRLLDAVSIDPPSRFSCAFVIYGLSVRSYKRP